MAFCEPAGRGRGRIEGGSSAVRHLTRLFSGGLVCPGWHRDTSLAPCFLALQLLFSLCLRMQTGPLVTAQEKMICSRQGRRQSLQTVTGSPECGMKTVSVLVLESCTIWVPKIQPVCFLWSHHYRRRHCPRVAYQHNLDGDLRCPTLRSAICFLSK